MERAVETGRQPGAALARAQPGIKRKLVGGVEGQALAGREDQRVGNRSQRAAKSDKTAEAANAEAMPTDKLLDVSPMALRMSSPFNAGYWTAAA